MIRTTQKSLEALAEGRKSRWPDFSSRFLANVRESGECHEWTAGKIRGYGYIERDGKKVMAHRVAYELAYGPIPKGLQIDHKCRNTSCVRADHLRLATNKQNSENKVMSRSNTSGFRGVSRHRDGVRWVAQVKNGRRNHYLGIFTSAEEAAAVARAKRCELFTHNDSDRGDAS